MIDVVGPEARANEFLEEVGLLVGALRAAEACEGVTPVAVADPCQPGRNEIAGLLPARLAEGGQDLRIVDDAARLSPPVVLAANVLRERPLRIRGVPADQGARQTLGVRRVVPAIAALHAQPSLVTGWTLPALGENDRVRVAVDVVGERAADTAIRTHTVDALELGARLQRQTERAIHERAGRTGRRTLAAGNTRAVAHRCIEVEGDPRAVALAGPTEDFVALDVVAGPDTAVAEYAGLMVDIDHPRARIDTPRRSVRLGESCAIDVVTAREGDELVVLERDLATILGRGVRLVAHQQVGQHPPVTLELLGVRRDLHPRLALTHAGGGLHPLPHVDDAHAADPNRIESRRMAEGRDLDPRGRGGFDDRLSLVCFDLYPVDGELHFILPGDEGLARVRAQRGVRSERARRLPNPAPDCSCGSSLRGVPRASEPRPPAHS